MSGRSAGIAFRQRMTHDVASPLSNTALRKVYCLDVKGVIFNAYSPPSYFANSSRNGHVVAGNASLKIPRWIVSKILNAILRGTHQLSAAVKQINFQRLCSGPEAETRFRRNRGSSG